MNNFFHVTLVFSKLKRENKHAFLLYPLYLQEKVRAIEVKSFEMNTTLDVFWPLKCEQSPNEKKYHIKVTFKPFAKK